MKQEHDYDLLEMRMQLLEMKVKLLEKGFSENSKAISSLLDIAEYCMSNIEAINSREENLRWDDWSD